MIETEDFQSFIRAMGQHHDGWSSKLQKLGRAETQCTSVQL